MGMVEVGAMGEGDRDRRRLVLLPGRVWPARLRDPDKGPGKFKAGDEFLPGVPSTPTGFSAAPARGGSAATAPLRAGGAMRRLLRDRAVVPPDRAPVGFSG